MGMSWKTLLVDGNNILVRAIKATEGKQVNLSADGVPTAALLVFINCIARYIKEEKPDRMLVAWDGGRSSHRVAIYPAYKANRGPERDRTEEVEHSPYALAKEFLTLANIHHVEQPHVEADDLIAAYWSRRENDEHLTILSGDKDFLQLLDGWTDQIRPYTGENERWTANRVRTDMGIKPEHIPLMMALTGDTSDGVPGIPGFGNKTACKALAQHEWDLDLLLTTNDPKWQKKLTGDHETVLRNLKLVTLRESFGIEVGIAPKLTPTTSTGVLYPAFLEWLDRYKLASVRQRLMEGTLWQEGGDLHGSVQRLSV